jgi:hypothetical protein
MTEFLHLTGKGVEHLLVFHFPTINPSGVSGKIDAYFDKVTGIVSERFGILFFSTRATALDTFSTPVPTLQLPIP